jgi:hypothetical protein
MLSMVRGTFIMASDTAVPERGADVLCGGRAGVREGGRRIAAGIARGARACSCIAAAGRVVCGTPEQRCEES